MRRPSSCSPLSPITTLVVALATTAVITVGWAAPGLASSPAPVFGEALMSLGVSGANGVTVSCTNATDCVAVGGEHAGALANVPAPPFRVSEVSGTPVGTYWPRPAQVGTQADSLTGVSCTDARDCTAVGYGDGGPTYLTETAGTWGTLTTLPAPGGLAQLLGVSCTDATDCTAVGGALDSGVPFYATESHGAWGAVTSLPSGGQLTAVSCTAATDCTAVGGLAFVTETAGVWGAVTDLPTPTFAEGYASQLTSVSCTSELDCTAVGDVLNCGLLGTEPCVLVAPIYVSETAGTWSAVTEASTRPGDFASVSCVDATDCTAVGADVTYGPASYDSASSVMYETESSGVWGPPVVLGQGELTGVSCTSSTDCTAVGDNGDGIWVGTVPGPPVIGMASVRAGRLSVAFKPPYDGGEPITSYTVLKSKGGAPFGVATTPTCTASPCTMGGLEGGKSYTFEVDATTQNGTGPASSSSNEILAPPSAPEAPRIGTVRPGDGSATVGWSPRWDGGTAITGYTATARQGSAAYRCRSSGKSCTIRGLTNGKTYTVSVVARNAVGTSASSPTRSVKPRR